MQLLRNVTLKSFKLIGSITSTFTKATVYARSVKTFIISELTPGYGVRIGFGGSYSIFKDGMINAVISWSNVTNKPTTFPPNMTLSTHLPTHTASYYYRVAASTYTPNARDIVPKTSESARTYGTILGTKTFSNNTSRPVIGYTITNPNINTSRLIPTSIATERLKLLNYPPINILRLVGSPETSFGDNIRWISDEGSCRSNTLPSLSSLTSTHNLTIGISTYYNCLILKPQNTIVCKGVTTNTGYVRLVPSDGEIIFIGSQSSATWMTSNKLLKNFKQYGLVCGAGSDRTGIFVFDATTTSGDISSRTSLLTGRYGSAGISGPQYGYIAGGFASNICNNVERLDLTTASGATSNSSVLPTSLYYAASIYSHLYGYTICGHILGTGASTACLALNFTTHYTYSCRPTAPFTRRKPAGFSNENTGFVCGGETGDSNGTNTVASMDLTSQSSFLIRRMPLPISTYDHCGLSGPFHGFITSGQNGTGRAIYYFDYTVDLWISCNTLTASHGVVGIAGISSAQYGFFAGGADLGGTPTYNYVDIFDYTSTSSSISNRGTLVSAQSYHCGLGS